MGRATWGHPRYLGPSPLTAEQGVLHFSHFRFIFVCRALPEDGRFCGYSAYSRLCGKINFEFKIMWVKLRITADLCLTSGLSVLSTVCCYLHFVHQLNKECANFYFVHQLNNHCEDWHLCTNWTNSVQILNVCTKSLHSLQSLFLCTNWTTSVQILILCTKSLNSWQSVSCRSQRPHPLIHHQAPSWSMDSVLAIWCRWWSAPSL